MEESTKYFQSARLIVRYMSGDLSEKELVELEEWKSKSVENARLFERILDDKNRISNQQRMKAVNKKAAWNTVSKAVLLKPPTVISFQKLMRYAAVFLLVLTSVASVYYIMQESKLSIRGKGTADIIPGSPKALLTLADGNVINLENKENELLKEKGGVIIQNRNFTLNYKDSTILNTKEENLVNTITVPRGGEFTVVLSDGSKVYLNSMTTLRYPVKLNGKQRKVELIRGEAFFEVAKDKNSPFIVNINSKAEVKVLGTQFDVNAYEDESTIKTTLLEGSVEVKVPFSFAQGTPILRVLHPGQQAIIQKNETDKIQIKDVDASIYASWRNGTFAFKDECLEDIMKTLARWYNIEVFFEYESLKEVQFAGNINKYSSINPILKMLQLTKKVKIEMDKNYILITKVNN